MKPQPLKHQHRIASTSEIKAKWQQQMGAAIIVWDKIAESDLKKIEGHQQRLAGLIQKHYDVSRIMADKQVEDFFNNY